MPRVRIRSAYFHAPSEREDQFGRATGGRDRSGSATPQAGSGGEAKGKRDRSGSTGRLFLKRGRRDRSGRAALLISPFGKRDRTGRATAEGQPAPFGIYTYGYTLAAHSDLTATTISPYVARVQISGDHLKQAPIGRIIHAQAWDLTVWTDDLTLQLDHQIEFYDGTNGVMTLAFRIPNPGWTTNTNYHWRIRYG